VAWPGAGRFGVEGACWGADGAWPAIDLQAGISHESNGQAGADSRSLNQLYAAPEFRWGGNEGFQLALTPRAWIYTGDLRDNPDIATYRGNMSLSAQLGWTDGVLGTALGRWGDDWDKGSLELDISYPVDRFIGAGLGFYLHAQLFTGYGENLLRYDEKTTRLRFGVSLVR
jgi:outer membrane phospholipase A